MKRIIICISVIAMFLNISGQNERDQIDDQYKWNLTDIYATDEAWNKDKKALINEVEKIESFKGSLTGSATQLLEALEFNSRILKNTIKLFIYAGMKSDLDTRDMTYLGMKQEIRQIMANHAAKTSFIKPEILTEDWSVYKGYLEEEPSLKPYEKYLKDMYRLKEHTPGEAEGRILGLSGMVSSVPASVHNVFTNAEMPNPEVTLSSGEKVILDSPGYARYRALPDREDRALEPRHTT